jgi:uncharacterized protein DUF6695|tara:strand:- start:35454 stop:35747 length:294 start_codon:yes stop_codon:yes gene_type:complete
MSLKSTLLPPQKPQHIPNESRWLAGEGAGSWFCIQLENSQYKITRYSPEGNIECEGFFSCKTTGFDIIKAYEFTHLSHCQSITIYQGNIVFCFERIN